MDIGNGDAWEGDWDAIDRWVIGLYPNLLNGGAGSDEEDVEPPEWPHAVEVYIGSRGDPAPSLTVDISEVEDADAASHVRVGIQRVLEDQPETRTSVVVRLRATRQDNDGEEVAWPQGGEVTRIFKRDLVVRPTTLTPLRVPEQPPPPTPPWQSPISQDPLPAQTPPVAANLTAPSSGVPAFGHAVSPVKAAFTSPLAPDLGGQAMLFAFQTLQGVIQTVVGEHRFLLDQNAALTDRLVSVHETAVQSMSRETSASRQTLERLNSEMMGLHRDTMTSQAETERVRLEAATRAEEKERQRVSVENNQLRETLEQALEQLQEAREAALTPEYDPETDPIRAKVAGAADQVLNAVLAELSKKGGDASDEPTTPEKKTPTPQGNQAPSTRRRRRRRPGAPGVRVADPDPEPEPEPDGSGGGAAFDLASLTSVEPAQAAFVLKTLPEETRRAALRLLVQMDRDFAIKMGTEFADAVDAHDGVRE